MGAESGGEMVVRPFKALLTSLENKAALNTGPPLWALSHSGGTTVFILMLQTNVIAPPLNISEGRLPSVDSF